MKTNPHFPSRPAPQGFTLVEMLVTIVIIVAIATLSMMGFSKVRDGSRRAVSIGHLRQLGIGMMTFSAENNGYLPMSRRGGTCWPTLIHPYLASEVFLRPGSKNRPASPTESEGYFAGVSALTAEGLPIRWNYIINGGGANLPFYEAPGSEGNSDNARGFARSYSSIEQPERTVFMAEGKESNWWFNNVGAVTNSPRIYRWKNGTSNVLFGDGSTRNLNPKTELPTAYFLVVKPKS
jgi:prepilin-type N-terminal cleavage/methylation domain-containing protein/prepilin-type processing-associated H-X9-DG protein